MSSLHPFDSDPPTRTPVPKHVGYRPRPDYTLLAIYPSRRLPVCLLVIDGPGGWWITKRYDWLAVN